MEQQAKKDFLINSAYSIVIGVIIFILSRFLFLYLMPFVIGAAIASLMQKPAGILSKKVKIKRGIVAAILSVIVYAALMAALVFIVIRLFVSAKGLVSILPTYIVKVSDYLTAFYNSIIESFGGLPDETFYAVNSMVDSALKNLATSAGSFFTSIAGNTVKNTPKILISSIVTVTATCYIALDYGVIVRFIKSMTSEKTVLNTVKIKEIIINCILKMIAGYLLIMVITFFELLLGFFILKIKYALPCAFLIALIDILPVLGTGTVLIPWAVISVIFGDTKLGIGIAVLYLIIIAIRNFLEPRIIGKKIGINPLLTLLSMFIGLKLMGAGGMILAPITVIVVVKYYKSQLEEDKINSKLKES